MSNWWRNYLARHRHPANRLLHAVGVPLTLAAVAVAAARVLAGQGNLWWPPAGLLAAGYFLQWLGHRIEGNDMGEIILIKKLLGRPYTAISPHYAGQSSNRPPANPDPS